LPVFSSHIIFSWALYDDITP